MKVLLVSNMYAYAGNWDKLDELGKRVDLAVITPSSWPVPELRTVMRVPDKPANAPWRQYRLDTYMQANGNPFRYFYKPDQLVAVLREFRPELLHVEQEPESLSLLQLSLLKPLFKYRLVFVAWEDINPLRLGWGFRKLNYALADAGIAGNPVALTRCRKLGFRKQLDCIPQYGFAITGSERPENRGDGRFVIGYAGRLVEEKGLRTLVAAARRVPGSEVVMAGDGPMADELRVNPQVRLLGWLPRTDLEQLWSQIDVLVLPSLTAGTKWTEQFGRVLVEAMAAGVPVIGSSSGRIPETIGDAGLVFPEGNAEALAEALNSLRDDPARRAELSRRGLGRVRDCYSHEVLMDRTVQFYNDMLAGK